MVEGDLLFANEPRNQGSDMYCPTQHGITDTITATAPFAMSPVAGGSYVLEAFFDTTGDFFPTFKFRELPEQGDVGGCPRCWRAADDGGAFVVGEVKQVRLLVEPGEQLPRLTSCYVL